MSLIPKVTTEDIRLALNGNYNSDSELYTFWEQTIDSGSVLAQINLANYYLYGALGTEVMDSTDINIMFHVNSCELAYSCMRTIIVLSGGVITDGFNWTAGINIQQPHMLLAWKNLIASFKDIAELHFRILQPVGFLMDADPLDLGDTTPSVM